MSGYLPHCPCAKCKANPARQPKYDMLTDSWTLPGGIVITRRELFEKEAGK